MKTILCLTLLLWTHVASAAFLFAPPRTVYHELSAPPIGETAYVNYSEYPRLSGDGSVIIYRVITNNVISVHAVNFDGTNDRVVDRITNASYRAYVLNGDGSVHASASDGSLRTGSTSAGAGTVALALDSGGINSPALSDDGSKVYFCVYNNGATAVTFAPVPKGLYEANANGSGRRVIASLGAVAAVLGAPADDNIRFYFAAASATAQQLVFAVTLNAYQHTNAILGVNRDGTGLHVIQRAGYYLRDVTISARGDTVAWGEYIGGGGNQVWSAGFDGSNARVVIPAADSPQEPLSLSTDGSDLMEGSGRIYRTYGLLYGTTGLGLRTVLYHPFGPVADPVLTAGALALLAPSGQRGVFVGGRRPYGNQVCTFEFNPAGLNGAPDILSHGVTPAYVRPASASTATASATVRFTGTSRGVATVCFRQGRYENLFYLTLPLFDNGTTGDPVAGDSQFVNNQLQYFYNDPAMLGPRTLRFHAESTDANGLRHATTVEHGNFFVVASAPPVIGGPTINPGSTTTTNGGRREVRFYGADFAPERTNNVVTLNGYPLDILTASGTELLVALPGWFADGIYAVICGKPGQVSLPVKYRSPSLPAPVIAPLTRPVANPLTLSWSAQLRAQYSILGSANLVNWLTLTNGVAGTNTNLSVDVDPAAIGGNAKFFRVVEESGVLE